MRQRASLAFILLEGECSVQAVVHSLGIKFYKEDGTVDYLNHTMQYKSMSRAGTPRDNAVIESFFGRFKDVMSSHFQYWKCDDIHKVVSDTIYYFNYIKPLRKLNKKPPVRYRIEQAA